MEPIDAKIIDAVRKVRSTVMKLTHDATNPHNDYTYLSIDSYYQQVVPAASHALL